MYRVMFVLAFAGVAVFASTMKAEDDDKLHKLMMKKLERSQKILEGIALNDFDKIAKNANDLIDISKEAEWRVIKTPQYELHSNDFRRTASNLAQNAKNKNLDGAALNYVDLTLTCVKCHKYVREERKTRLDLFDDKDLVLKAPK